MADKTLIKDASIVNEGKINVGDVLIEGELIAEIGTISRSSDFRVIEAKGKFLLPGIIDSHVHFRDPGLNHKGEIFTESRAAVAGGVTTFLEMPNTIPNVLGKKEIDAKNKIASQNSIANYGFYMGVCHKNLDYVLNLNPNDCFCITDDGLYMSGANLMLSESPETMEKLFSGYKGLIAIHSEHEDVIHDNLDGFTKRFGEHIPFNAHAEIRSELACFLSTVRAVSLARRTGARLHLLHLSTNSELSLLDSNKNVTTKKITAEVCIPHLWFCDKDYDRLGGQIKCNPSIKSSNIRASLLAAVNDDRIDIISTDHAPHTLAEKLQSYSKCPSGMPMVQHSLSAMLEFYLDGRISIEKLVEKMCHNPANLFQIEKRGYIKAGYFADLAIVDTNLPWTVSKDNILYKCNWSPLEGQRFRSKVTNTFVNGNIVYTNSGICGEKAGREVSFFKVSF
jgi:dihydroorotase